MTVETPSLSARAGRPLIERLIAAYAAVKDDQETMEQFERHFADHLVHLRGLKIVKSYDGVPNRSLALVREWNVMCGTETDPYSTPKDETAVVAGRFAWRLAMHAVGGASGTAFVGMSADERERAIRKVETRIDAGDVGHWHMGGQEHDHVSGEDFAYEMRGWNLVVGRAPKPGAVMTHVEDLEQARLHLVEIEIPSGQLLLADWFRAEGFTELVDEGDQWRGGSVRESEADAERYRRDHGFTSVRSACRSLTVISDGSTIAVGRHSEDGEFPLPKGYGRIRNLCIDLRQVSVVDRRILDAILTGIHGPVEASRMTEEVAASHDTVDIAVRPGRYRIVSSGRGLIGDLLPAGHPLKAEGFEPVMFIERA